MSDQPDERMDLLRDAVDFLREIAEDLKRIRLAVDEIKEQMPEK